MRSEKTPYARRHWGALIFLLLGTLAGVWHTRQIDRGQSDMVVSGVRGAVVPPVNALGKVSRWMGEKTSWIFHGYATAEENRHLREQVAALQSENAALQEAKINYERLRDELGFVHKAARPMLAADVVARRPDPRFDTLVISVGSRDGVRPNSVVVARGGLVGRVMDVTPTTASVLMLTDQNAGAGGRVQRANSRATGVCKGDNSRILSLLYLPADADVKTGDIVVTSGLGGVYPAGLFIGTVTEVRPDESKVSRTARIRPGADFDRLEEVFVLP